MKIKRRGRRLELVLDGELDIASTTTCPTPGVLVGTDLDTLVVDMRELVFLDLEGMRYVMQLRAVALERGCEFRIIPGPRQIRRVFELTGTEHQLHHAA